MLLLSYVGFVDGTGTSQRLLENCLKSDHWITKNLL